METFTLEEENLLEKSRELKSGLGAIAWATLEMLKRGGMPKANLDQLQDDLNTYFARPTNEECNTVLRVVEKRLNEDRVDEGTWYS